MVGKGVTGWDTGARPRPGRSSIKKGVVTGALDKLPLRDARTHAGRKPNIAVPPPTMPHFTNSRRVNFLCMETRFLGDP